MPVSIGLLGAYEQWGVSSGHGAADITFPITFGTLYSITQGFCNSGSVNNWNWAISSYSVSKFHVIGKGGIGLFWIAVGKAQQWGFVHTRTTTVEFNIPFTKVFACVGTNTSSVGNAVPSCGITNLTNSSFTMSVFANDNVGTSDVTWMALGA